MQQQKFINLAYNSTEHPIIQKIILDSKAPSKLTIDRPKKSKLKVFKRKVLLTNQTTNKIDTTN